MCQLSDLSASRTSLSQASPAATAQFLGEQPITQTRHHSEGLGTTRRRPAIQNISCTAVAVVSEDGNVTFDPSASAEDVACWLRALLAPATRSYTVTLPTRDNTPVPLLANLTLLGAVKVTIIGPGVLSMVHAHAHRHTLSLSHTHTHKHTHTHTPRRLRLHRPPPSRALEPPRDVT
jgi:hypothetical protein